MPLQPRGASRRLSIRRDPPRASRPGPCSSRPQVHVLGDAEAWAPGPGSGTRSRPRPPGWCARPTSAHGLPSSRISPESGLVTPEMIGDQRALPGPRLSPTRPSITLAAVQGRARTPRSAGRPAPKPLGDVRGPPALAPGRPLPAARAGLSPPCLRRTIRLITPAPLCVPAHPGPGPGSQAPQPGRWAAGLSVSQRLGPQRSPAPATRYQPLVPSTSRAAATTSAAPDPRGSATYGPTLMRMRPSRRRDADEQDAGHAWPHSEPRPSV